MRFDLTEEQQFARETARRFLESEAPLSDTRARYDRAEGFSREWWGRASGLGWTALGLPESAGGFALSGKTAQDLAIIAEELGRIVAPGLFAPTVAVLDALAKSPHHLAAFVPDVIAGSKVATWAYGEPGDRWTPAEFETRADREDDQIVLRGRKAYVEAGAQADVLLVTARSAAGLSQVLVPTDAPGVAVKPGRSIDFVRRFAEVFFDDVRLPIEAGVGESGAAAGQVERQLQLVLLLQCAEINGAVERAMEFTIEYMRDRYAFGRAIASYQALKHRLADMLLKLQSCMATNDAAIDAFDAGSPEAGKLTRVAKTFVASKATAIMGELVQMTGGIALTFEHDLHLYERRVAVNRANFGTPEQHRAAIHRILAA